MNFVIIHYNTPELTTCLCSSIKKLYADARIIMFDNSDKRPFTNYNLLCNTYFDNTNSQYINFENELSKYKLVQSVYALNKCGSAKHCMTIQWLFDNLTIDDFILVDSDILLYKQLPITHDSVIIGEYERYPGNRDRLPPFICYINLLKLKQLNINYFDAQRMNGLSICGNSYDTGASFLEDLLAKNVNIQYINCLDYCVHFRCGSWSNKDYKTWLLQHKRLWQ